MRNGQYIIILGDDDIIVQGGINKILFHLKHHTYDVMYCNTYGFSDDYRKEMSNSVKGKKVFSRRDRFLTEIILCIRQISAIIIRSAHVDQMVSITGNFAHLHHIFTAIKQGKKFVMLREPIIACRSNNSEFDHTANFSDIYVSEFFTLFKGYFKNSLMKSAMRKIENRMLLFYYPIYLYKIKTGRLRGDCNQMKNFNYFFHQNPLYRYILRFIFHGNYLLNRVLLALLIVVSKFRQGLLFHYLIKRQGVYARTGVKSARGNK